MSQQSPNEILEKLREQLAYKQAQRQAAQELLGNGSLSMSAELRTDAELDGIEAKIKALKRHIDTMEEEDGA